MGWHNKETPARLVSFDIMGRFLEFEHHSADAFWWRQESEIPPDDSELHEWWLAASSAKAGGALASGYSEDQLYKFGTMSNKLSFLDSIKWNELIRFLDSDPVGALREDLAVVRSRVRRTPDTSLSQTIDETGTYLVNRMLAFEEHLEVLGSDSKSGIMNVSGKFASSVALSFAATLFPPLSIAGLLWGASAEDVVQRVKSKKAHFAAQSNRPIATLTRWWREHRGPKPIGTLRLDM